MTIVDHQAELRVNLTLAWQNTTNFDHDSNEGDIEALHKGVA